MRLRRLVHSGLEIITGSTTILIDPGMYCFVNGHPFAQWQVTDFKPDILLFTHCHPDHFQPDMAATIIRASNCVTYGTVEVVRALEQLDIKTVHFPVGSEAVLCDVKLRSVPADHRVAEECIGYVLSVEGKLVYHCGDTHYMAKKPAADLLFVPIGNLAYTMGPEDAAKFASEINPKLVIPFHYESPKMNVKPEQFAELMATTGISTRILAPGEWFTF